MWRRFRVLDECDEMLNMGFVDDVEKILGAGGDIQVGLWLAAAQRATEGLMLALAACLVELCMTGGAKCCEIGSAAGALSGVRAVRATASA